MCVFLWFVRACCISPLFSTFPAVLFKERKKLRHFGIGRLHMQKEWYQWTEKCDIILLLRLMTPTALLAKEQKKKDKCVVWIGVSSNTVGRENGSLPASAAVTLTTTGDWDGHPFSSQVHFVWSLNFPDNRLSSLHHSVKPNATIF